jgi:hypothetical protein
MYPVYLVIGMILITALIGAFFKRKEKLRIKQGEAAQASYSELAEKDAINFVNKLQELGYFKYADPKHIGLLRENMIGGYDSDNELISVWTGDTGMPLDFRYYFCDNEDLFEEGGFTDMLKYLQPTFDKIGLSIEVTEHIEEWDQKNNWLNHSITINNNKYVVFKNFIDGGWGEAAQRFADIINRELENQQKEDRVYLVSGGNDGKLIFLNPSQFDYIDSVYKNKYWKPLKVRDWCEVMKVDFTEIN